MSTPIPADMYESYRRKICTLDGYRQTIENKRDSLSSIINSTQRSIKSDTLSFNSMQNDYYAKFVAEETACLDAARKIRDSITNTILPSIGNRLASLKKTRDYWKGLMK